MGRYKARLVNWITGGLKVNGVAVDGGADIEGVTATDAELNVNAGVTPGTVTASKTLVVDSNKDLAALRTLGVQNLDAGASGVVGSVDVFPTTAAKGKTTLTASDNAGNTQTILNTKAQAAARTYEVPDAGASCNFSMGLRQTEAHTSGDTLLAAESGSVHTNEGASGTVTLVLPAATVGQRFLFFVMAAFELRIDPNTTQTIALPSSGVQGAAGKYLVADAVGEFVELICVKAGQWERTAFAGTWTAEG